MREIRTPHKNKNTTTTKSMKKANPKSNFLSADELLDKVIPRIEALFNKK